MPFDVLLHWMTHRGSGGWASFRDGVERLVGRDEDITRVSLKLCRAMSCLGYADFFVEQSARWVVKAPALAGMPSAQAALVIGGRTPSLVKRIGDELAKHGCSLHVEESYPVSVLTALAPSTVCADVAAVTGIAHMSSAPELLLGSTLPLELSLQSSEAQSAPINWDVSSFDLSAQRWIPGALPQAAREYRPRHGRSRYFVHVRGTEVKPLGRRESIYCSALMKGHPLLHYERERRQLTCPARAPLPYEFARIACLCSGRLPVYGDDVLTYTAVPPRIAAAIIAALGQPLSTARVDFGGTYG